MPTCDLDVAIGALRPELQLDQLALNLLVVRGAFDRIRDSSEEDIGFRLADMMDCGLNVFHPLSFVTPHQKHPALNLARPAHLDGPLHLLHLHAAIHRIEQPLRTTLRTDPNTKATELREQIEHFFVEPIRARDAFEGNMETASAHLCGVLAYPFMVDREDVVRHPGDIRRVLSE